MDIPMRDRRTKEDIIEYMNTCAKQYVPEWRYDQEHPDAGTALVSLFADMMYDNIRRFNQSVAMDMFSFFDEVNAKMLPARPAEGFITFALPADLESEDEVPAGTRLLAETPEGQLIFETREEVLVRQMDIGKIYLSNPYADAIYQIYDREKEAMPSFFLFRSGEKNLQQHTVYFCFDRGLEIRTIADARLTLCLESRAMEGGGSEALLMDPSVIRFSYGTAEGYREFSGAEALQETKPARGEPAGTAARGTVYREGELRFTMEGGEEGIAPREEQQSLYVIRADILNAELFSRIFVRQVSLSVRSKDRRPDLIHVNGTDQEPEDVFVFGDTLSLYNEFYIASDEVFGKSGARIEIEFDLDFVKIPLEMPAAEKIVWKSIMRKGDFAPDKEYDISIAEVLWEYYNGYGWTRLPVSAEYKKLFSVGEDPQSVKGRRARIEFCCPGDMERVLVNSAESFCLRARIMKMNNAYKTKGAYIAPVAGSFSLSYDYEEAPLTPVRIVRQNNMETQTFEKEEIRQEGFAFPFSSPNPDRKLSCYLGFEHPPVGSPLKMLFVMHDTMPGSMPGIEWEYLGEKGWNRMNLADRTEDFHHTGLVSWSGSQDIRRKVLFGQELFWIRLTDTEEAYQDSAGREYCPKIDGIYPNSTSILGIETVEETFGIDPHDEEKRIWLSYTDIAELEIQVLERMDYESGVLRQVWETWTEAEELREDCVREYVADRQEGRIDFPKYMNSACLSEQGEIRIRVRYGYCRGDRGNLKSGEISRLGQTVGFISQSYNPIASVGGSPREKVSEAIRRNAGILRHGYRCVSAQDYEAMAWEATRDISRIKCFSGYDRNRNREPGAVTLVVLPKDYEDNSYSFEKTKLQIYEYLSGHMDQNLLNLGKFHIVRPELIRLDVKVTIELSQKNEIFGTKKRVLEELEHFLDPLYGSFHGEGWEIGMIPDKNQIMHALKRVDGVKHISQITLRKYRRGRFEDYEINEETRLSAYFLPKSGNHEVLLLF